MVVATANIWKRQQAAALQMDRGTTGGAEISGKARNCRVLEVLQRPASEGEPYNG